MPRNDLIQVRRDTAANWTSANPTLASGEIGLETDTGRYKIGNGTTPWNSLQINLEVDNLVASGNIEVDNLVASGDVELGGGITAQAVVSLDSGVFVGPVSVGDTLSVEGESTLNDNLYVNGLVASNEVEAYNSIRLDNKYLTPYNGFRNAIINGDFRINQRLWSSSTTNGAYGFDRWKIFNTGGTVTMSSQSFTVGSPAAIGYESARFCRVVVAGQSESGHYAVLQQPIEDVRTFANSTVTVSFWAKASSTGAVVSVELSQVFGSGGSPSSDVDRFMGAVVLSTSWTRYSVTYTVPGIDGKTIGTIANTSRLNCNLWVSAEGPYLEARTVLPGAQNFTFDFWGVQVERGSVATPFEQRPVGTELALCQRYYYSEDDAAIPMYPDQNGTGSRNRYFAVQFPVTMRTEGTASGYTGTGIPSVYYITPNNCVFYKQSSANTYGVDLYSWTIDAEL